MVAMNRYRRKAVFVENRVNYGDVAESVGCDISTVSRIASGLTVRETDMSLRVKAELARRAGMRVDELWPPALAATG
jgi:hypothetical protein